MDPKTASTYLDLFERLRNPGKMTDERRRWYDQILEITPMDGDMWNQYISEEKDSGSEENVIELFKRCLPEVPSIRLFQSYLNYLVSKEANDQILSAAYDFALSKIGLDIESIDIYVGYLQIPKDATKQDPIYKKAFSVPLKDLHKINEFFSRDSSVMNFSDYYNSLKSNTYNFFKEKNNYHLIISDLRGNITDGINQAEATQFKWRKYIDKEKAVLQRTSPERRIAFIDYAYRCALVANYFSWRIWCEYALFYASEKIETKCIEIFEKAIQIFPQNVLLAFYFAEFFEKRNRFPDGNQVFVNLLERLVLASDLTLAAIAYLKFLYRVAGVEDMRVAFVKFFENEETASKLTHHLVLAFATIELETVHDFDASLRVILFGVDLYSNVPDYLFHMVPLLLKLKAFKKLQELIPIIQACLDNVRFVQALKSIHSELRYQIDHIEFLKNVEQLICQYDENASMETLFKVASFLPDI